MQRSYLRLIGDSKWVTGKCASVLALQQAANLSRVYPAYPWDRIQLLLWLIK